MTLAIGNPGKLPEGRGMFKPHKLYSVGSEGHQRCKPCNRDMKSFEEGCLGAEGPNKDGWEPLFRQGKGASHQGERRDLKLGMAKERAPGIGNQRVAFGFRPYSGSIIYCKFGQLYSSL